jgi:hypothetical protein
MDYREEIVFEKDAERYAALLALFDDPELEQLAESEARQMARHAGDMEA